MNNSFQLTIDLSYLPDRMMIKNKENIHSLTNGFSKLRHLDRLTKLIELGAIIPNDLIYFQKNNAPPISLAEKLIENVIGYFHLPLGVAVNFCIDGIDYVIPMAVEETSIIAAASKTAKWVRDLGEITTEAMGSASIGQIQVAKVKNFDALQQMIEQEKPNLIAKANAEIVSGLVSRGGGVRDITVRKISRGNGENMALLHVLVDTCDAMGANSINQICEFLKTPIQDLSGEQVAICILSNLNDTKLTRAKVVLHNIDPVLGEKIEEASLFAEIDPYRAATSNKGVLNGMDPILIATGNDWRAVEAGVHAYACRDGQYRSITRWRMQQGDLIGQLVAPVMVGIVGGVTTLHPTSQICLKMMNITSAEQLARIITAVGLVQNLGAIRALTTVGIVEGHMKLHIDNLALNAGANEHEAAVLKERLMKILEDTRHVTLGKAIDILHDIRS